MKIALAQINVKLGQIEKNYQKIANTLRLAKEKGVYLVAFPEMCLSGYLMSDRWNDDNFCSELMNYNEKIRALSKEFDISIVYGNIYKIDNLLNHDGRTRKYNAAYLIDKGEVAGIHTKHLLPTYRMFDDARYFYSDAYVVNILKPYKLKNGSTVGLEVCEELWYKDYEINPTKILIDKGAELIINISASPFSVNKSTARNNRIKELKQELGTDFVPFYYINCVGMQNNGKSIVIFDGDSRIYDKNGCITQQSLKPYEEGLLLTDFNQERNVVHVVSKDFIKAERVVSAIEQKFLALQEAYKSMDEILNKPQYVFGLSGGIDSSLNAALCRLAIKEDRIHGYNMPSKFNKEITKTTAEKLAQNLRIKYEIISINDILSEYKQALNYDKTITEENLQARIRTLILLAKTSELGNGVLINNTNKIELALGYGTLYGDLAGAWCPLADLTKVEIWEMSRMINKAYGNIIPQELIPNKNLKFDENKIAPSAELKERQIDPMIWGLDDWLIEKVMTYKSSSPEKILRLYISKKEKELFAKYGMDDSKNFIEHIEWFFGKLYTNVFKRIQAPPILVLSKSAFGADYRESQYKYEFTKLYKKLKEEILKNN
ncbi:MAG: NAD(+) synthase [Endomicrobium sp.]|jgi:NAD+ synthase (glutamine-hydrolysing)|nr:NAD(+) synthase [Endomicrobium sp.]